MKVIFVIALVALLQGCAVYRDALRESMDIQYNPDRVDERIQRDLDAIDWRLRTHRRK